VNSLGQVQGQSNDVFYPTLVGSAATTRSALTATACMDSFVLLLSYFLAINCLY